MRAVALVAFLGLTTVLALPTEARADEIDTCANAYEAAQRLHKKDDPKALGEAVTCARDVCPDVLRKECSIWVKEWTPAERPADRPVVEAPKSEPAPAPAAAPSFANETSRPVPMLTYVLGGGGLVALGVASAFALHGVSVRNDLAASGCEPNCAIDRVDSARTSFLAADVFGVAGVAALGGALAIYLTRPEVRGDQRSARPRVELSPLLAGAAVRGTF